MFVTFATLKFNKKLERKTKIRLVVYTLYLFLLILLLEVGCRIFLLKKFPTTTSFNNFSTLIYNYYPTLKSIRKDAPRLVDENFDILLLGGSVLHPNNGEVEEELRKQLKALQTKRPILIYNASTPAHTSRDSKIKMDLLSDRHFDLVLFYHGINEVRANNCDSSIFKEDYSHIKWYDEINGILNSPKRYTAIPIAMNYLRINLYQRVFPNNYIPKELPRRGWTEFGSEVKTKQAFLSNIESIYKQTSSNGTKFVLPTFTYWLDENYSWEYFEKTKDRDDRPRMPVKIWGKPLNVMNGIKAHNGAIKELANNHADILMIDTHAQMPKGDLYYDDICHLSKAGSKQLVQIIVKSIAEEIEEDK